MQVAYDLPLFPARWLYAHATRQCNPPLAIEIIEHNDLENATLLGEDNTMIDLAEHARAVLMGAYTTEELQEIQRFFMVLDGIIGDALYAEDELLEATNQQPKYGDGNG